MRARHRSDGHVRSWIAGVNLVGVDIDLRKIYAWHSSHGALVNGTDDVGELFRALAAKPAKILVEIAGPVDYSDNKAIAHNKRRWTIYNVARAAMLHTMLPDIVLVAPSSAWTHGYPKDVRHKLAKADAKNHDLRECQSMVWSYRMDPTRWRPLPEFLAAL